LDKQQKNWAYPSIPTFRRWEAEGKIQSVRIPHGHRRYDLAQLRGLKPYEASKTNRPTLCYARVSSHDQKEDLLRQVLAPRASSPKSTAWVDFA
jgi:predicted site-specific integrase-resolvase